MKYNHFIALVKRVGNLRSDAEAEKASLAVLEIFASLLGEKKARNVAAQLPGELRMAMLQVKEHGPFPLPEFFRRIADKEGVPEPEAMAHAQAVLAMLQEAITEGELDSIYPELTPEYQEFLNQSAVAAKSTGHLFMYP